MKKADINKAINELSAMTDQELNDIGTSRGSIRQAVIGDYQIKEAA